MANKPNWKPGRNTSGGNKSGRGSGRTTRNSRSATATSHVVSDGTRVKSTRTNISKHAGQGSVGRRVSKKK